ncbi:Sia-alpha-2,3-Gal-beta-1,4-GlcNAc-R:alpha 2,8-sialyltransferase [Chelonia mydas]|uniref:Sia-alpha-2,3-Gal-beta-1,4-GlcNAc-R:alpha 2,8-sialyltransferase n=1 Tax=Chelonia mydas TaxID=8469 RepID=M7AQ13_CHEMY|nr:Sia-alpha-2,3-Gal-beta-1,4-GlcNAc-R:alpha 2,8-sialyltransferase [Chelonia mydas]
MLSVALLILSLISYVSLKKDNIFTTPRYASSGVPRMYMFHAGFRSQFALKFLDPSFVPITNSLTHELQEKPSKWTFNRTAFLHQRQGILQHVDVIKNFSLTKNSVRIGQLMHYDYSSHKYVFSISNNFRSLLPDVSPVLNKHYNICAVVGNSGILTGSQCGQEIDKSDFVFRCNFAPTEAFQKDVGRKTNLTTFNPSILEKYYNNLLTIQDRNNFFLSLKKLDGAILWIPAFFFHTSATVTRTLVDFFVEHRGQLKVQLAWPGNIMQHVNRYWKNKHLSPKRLSTAFVAIVTSYELTLTFYNGTHNSGKFVGPVIAAGGAEWGDEPEKSQRSCLTPQCSQAKVIEGPDSATFTEGTFSVHSCSGGSSRIRAKAGDVSERWVLGSGYFQVQPGAKRTHCLVVQYFPDLDLQSNPDVMSPGEVKA